MQPGAFDTVLGQALDARIDAGWHEAGHTDITGRTRPAACAARARDVGRRSEQPMQITGERHDPLPGDTFSAWRATVA